MRRAVFLLALSLHAQDAELVLRTMVEYNTMQARGRFPEELSSEVSALARTAQAAGRDQKFGEALRNFHHGITLMEGSQWTPEAELASSLQPQLDRAIVDHGKQTRLSLTPLYPLDRPATTTLSLTLRNNSNSYALLPSRPLKHTDLPLHLPVTIPDDAKGTYDLIATVGTHTKSVRLLIGDLSEQAARLKARLAKTTHPTVAFALDEYENAVRATADPHRTNFPRSFAEAHRILDAIEAGQDPYANKTGDMRKAYRSTVDNTLQPYRLFIPTRKPTAIVIALHGMGGSENSFFDGYGRTNLMQREAEKHGFIVACPKGRGPASMYKGSAEKDVLDVLAEVQRDYPVNPKRVFLMGHSMGAYGTWSIAMDHPELWAALGPISGGGDPTGAAKIKHIPQYIVHGDNDKAVPVALSRLMANAGKKLGARIEYYEEPGGTHVGVAAPHFAPMFNFFDRINAN